jgi:hypothetical protein
MGAYLAFLRLRVVLDLGQQLPPSIFPCGRSASRTPAFRANGVRRFFRSAIRTHGGYLYLSGATGAGGKHQNNRSSECFVNFWRPRLGPLRQPFVPRQVADDLLPESIYLRRGGTKFGRDTIVIELVGQKDTVSDRSPPSGQSIVAHHPNRSRHIPQSS